ncbi:MAG: AMP-binding protein, partial [Arachnia sp.]
MDLARQVAEMLDGGPALWLAPGPRIQLPPSVGAVVATSGSTGSPRRVVLPRDALLAAARAAASRLGQLTWHLALPEGYVAGLMVHVRARLAGGVPRQAGADLAGLLPTGDGDAISVVPTQLYRALRDPHLVRTLAAMDAVLVGGAGLAPRLREQADAAGVRIIETYGMSETC